MGKKLSIQEDLRLVENSMNLKRAMGVSSKVVRRQDLRGNVLGGLKSKCYSDDFGWMLWN